MKAVVMAGGEGTRLRPLTSNQPKPMVPIVGKPCMEHIVELLRRHGMDDVIVTGAFLPQAIRSYFGDGESLGVNIEYSVEESPLGTAGSVRLASGRLDDTFVVISGDALTDVNLEKIVAFHREEQAAVTIGLKSVENPLEFGIVVTDDEGRIERFLEKPSWGQVFSDTINTGIYVLEPEVLRHIPTDRPSDFSKELFPRLREMGRPTYGYMMAGSWADIGNRHQYRRAHFTAVGAESVIMPGVRIYPYKEVETGSQIFESVIWESRGTTRIFRTQGVSGLVNVDLTPDIAVRLAAALGTALKRGERVVASRDGAPACRMIKRAMISGLSSTGVDVADLRVIPAAVGRHLVKAESFAAGFHVGLSPGDPEAVRIQFFEAPGIEMSSAMQQEVEKHFTRGEIRRVASADVGTISYPARVREGYASDLLDTIDVDAIRERSFRLVVDYGFSASSYVLPLVLAPLGVEAVAAHAFPSDGEEAPSELATSIGQAKRLVAAVGADLGAVFDRAGERLYLIDEQAREIPVEQALLLYLRLIGSNGGRGKLAFPVTVTSQVDRLTEGSGLEVVRTPASLQALTQAAAEDDVVFAGAPGGGYVFPHFLA